MTTRDRVLLSLLLYQGKTSYQKIYSFLPPGYSQPNFYGILRRMEADQLIKRSLDRHLAALRLGPDALSFLESRFGPRIKCLLSDSANNVAMKPASPAQRGEQCNNFSLVIYDFPLSMAYHRARLQNKLEQLGMGMLRKGVYISPYDILKLVAFWAEENQILDHIYLLTSNPSPGDPAFKRTSDKIWSLADLAKQYLTILDRLAIIRGQQILGKRISGLRRIKSDFLEIVSRDPLLPRSLLSSDWPLVRVIQALTGID